MEEIYIKKSSLTKWIGKYFNKDLITIGDLISTIEDLDSQIEKLQEQLEEKTNDYPNEERDREIEILGI